jgi:hypothetical protein
MWWQPETGSGTRRKDSGSWATAVWSVSSECDVEFSPHDMAVVIPTPWNVGSSKCASASGGGGGGCGDPSPDSKGGTRGSGGDSGSGYSRLLRDLFAGAFTGGFTKTAVAPLERVKVILQLQVWNASSLATVFEVDGHSLCCVLWFRFQAMMHQPGQARKYQGIFQTLLTVS